MAKIYTFNADCLWTEFVLKTMFRIIKNVNYYFMLRSLPLRMKFYIPNMLTYLHFPTFETK